MMNHAVLLLRHRLDAPNQTCHAYVPSVAAVLQEISVPVPSVYPECCHELPHLQFPPRECQRRAA